MESIELLRILKDTNQEINPDYLDAMYKIIALRKAILMVKENPLSKKILICGELPDLFENLATIDDSEFLAQIPLFLEKIKDVTPQK